MGKRSMRFLHHQILENKDKFTQQDIQCVTWKGQTYYGLCKEVNDRFVALEDKNSAWYNRKKHQHQIELSNIKEIIFDKISEW
ncbi:MAG: hypothetical protein AAFY71_20045 [Bacteroidota bacterium]